MSTRFRGYWLVFLPAVAALAAVVACGDDDDGGTPSTPDASVADTSTSHNDANDSGSNAQPDTGIADAGHDADVALPDLCVLYPNAVVPGDASVGEPPDDKRFDLISYRAIVAASGTCEVGDLFANIQETPPDELGCLANELSSLARCTVAGELVPYKGSADGQGNRCAPDSGTSALLGLHLPPGTPAFTLNDVDFIIDRICDAAIETGFTVADAERLRQLLRADRTTIVPDAGTKDAGYSQSECQ